MKLTHPFVVLGAIVVVGAGIALATHKPKPPPKTVTVEAPAGTPDTVTIDTTGDKAELATFITDIDARTTTFSDAGRLAINTPKISLAPIVADMQKQLRSNESLTFPKCMQPARDFWLDFQRTTIDTFMGFMAGSTDEQFVQSLEAAGTARRR